MSEELKPCPLCGEKPQILFVSSPLGAKWMIKCCMWHELTFYSAHEKKDLTQLWNKRKGRNK